MPKRKITNSEWELHELIESLTSELDRFEDTLSLKSYARGVTFGLTNLNLELNVFVRFDSKKGKWLFRSANPGETGASTLKIELPSLIRDEIETHGRKYEDIPDTRPINILPGIKEVDIIGLNRLGIFMVGDLMAMSTTQEMRNVIAYKTQIEEETLSRWLKIPYIKEVKSEGNELLIMGENFANLFQRHVLIDGNSTEIVEWGDNQIRIKAPEGIKRGSIVVAGDRGVSNRFPFRID